ncbi:hypothetical protein RvY_14638-2 [Ramazzottius varieornatus]|uniref:Uncharacterized protein n=1 Tax=Ramazzottius varieornatus TaxID=947166 RepID=A0A1D1VS11_RAMVA|nr:hypothetical protein RvY_14638-2 [Ramazzottius varieornatus]
MLYGSANQALLQSIRQLAVYLPAPSNFHCFPVSRRQQSRFWFLCVCIIFFQSSCKSVIAHLSVRVSGEDRVHPVGEPWRATAGRQNVSKQRRQIWRSVDHHEIIGSGLCDVGPLSKSTGSCYHGKCSKRSGCS